MTLPPLKQPCSECHAIPQHLPDCPVLVDYQQEQHTRTLLLAVEFGYRYCEKGHNLEATLAKFVEVNQ